MTGPESKSEYSRRTIVQGAAWSVPVIASTIAVSNASASAIIDCPDFGAESGWNWAWDNPAQMIPRPSDGGAFWVGGQPRTFVVNGDNRDNSAAAAPLLVGRLTKQIPVVAGTTYVFKYQIASWSQFPNWAPMNVRATVGDQAQYDTSRVAMNHSVGAGSPVGPYVDRTLTYTATTTGTIPFTFMYSMAPANGVVSFDDIFIRFPADSTSCTR